MSLQLYQLKDCPVCGAEIPVSPRAEEVSCKFCGNTFEVSRRNGKRNGMPSPGFWTGFGVATILWFIVIPVVTPAATAYLARKAIA